MEKIRSSPLPSLSSLFPWLSPLVIKFAVVSGGIEVQLYRDNRLLKNWHASKLRHVLPEPLTRWIDNNHISMGPQPYPLIMQLLQYITPLASKKLIIDSSALTELEEISQPQDFALVWELNRSLERIEGRYEGADRYLGMGWFQKERKIWSLNTHPPYEADSQLRNPIVSVQQTEVLLSSTIPYLKQYLPTRADFQLITDFEPQVVVPDARSGGITLALQCKYPQFLPTIQISRQVDTLLADQAIIQFPHQSLTPVMIQLLRSGSSVIIRGADVPFFISEHLPIMRRYRQISDEMTAKITEANPIVPIEMLKPTPSFIQAYENGIGKCTTAIAYQYQQQTFNGDALRAAHQQNQRFVQQHGIWFEWPYNFILVQPRWPKKVLRPEEVMGFDTRGAALLPEQPIAYAIQPGGATPVERGQSIFEQLRYYGIPGGIVDESKGSLTTFVDACEKLSGDNPQARILWLVPSSRKGPVTRTISDSSVSNCVTVASPATLRNEPELISHSWTLVIFHRLDELLDGSSQSRMLSQLKWQWALTSVTAKHVVSPAIMPVLHLPEQYYEQFCAHYLFALESSDEVPLSPASAEIISDEITKADEKSSPLKETGRDSEPQPVQLQSSASLQVPSEQMRTEPVSSAPIASNTASETASISRREPKKARGRTKSAPAPSPKRPAIELNQKKIAALREESQQLQERLIVEAEEEQEVQPISLMPEPAPVVFVASEATELAPEVDEDWKVILQQWRPEHWEIIRLLHQEQPAQLTMVERKAHRPVSRLIDEINFPVDEQLGDLLIDPDTQTISSHLHTMAESLVRWHLSSV